MTGDKPLVSIGMPVYNGEKYLRQALDSLLTQTYENFELIISDNASTDGTQEICLEYAARDKRIQYHQNIYNRGAVWNFNKVLELASGEYFMWAAYDDFRDINALTLMVLFFLNNSETIFVGSYVEIKNYVTGNSKLDITAKLQIKNSYFENCVLLLRKPTPNFIYGLFRTDILRQTSFSQLKHFDFFDVFLSYEIATMGKMHVIPIVLHYSGVVDTVRVPKSFARLRIPGFTFGYSEYYFKSLRLFLRSRLFTYQQKVHLIELLNTQIIKLITNHEQKQLGQFRINILRNGTRFINKILSLSRTFSY
jgi:glycosyltransferase involved in cell wall biosynthesis